MDDKQNEVLNEFVEAQEADALITEEKNEQIIETIEQESNKEMLEMKGIIDKHFSTIEGLVRYSKTKDANVLTLSKQIQDYREGFVKNIYKRIALELIAFREECRKSIRELNDSITQEVAEKYIGFLCDDYFDLMQNLGISKKDDKYLYNGKLLDASLENAEFKEVPLVESVQVEEYKIDSVEGLMEYLKTVENIIVSTLKNNSIIDSLLNDYIKIASIYEQGLYQVILYPTIRKIIGLYEVISGEKDILNNENAKDVYLKKLEEIITSLEDILFLLDVSIDNGLSDFYDAKTNRILKTLTTDDPDANGKVAFRYTECYVMDDKVIYPSKVDIYKFNQ